MSVFIYFLDHSIRKRFMLRCQGRPFNHSLHGT
jgi:hypothetical protein